MGLENTGRHVSTLKDIEQKITRTSIVYFLYRVNIKDV